MIAELQNADNESACFLCLPPVEGEQAHNNLTRRQVVTHGLFPGGTHVVVLWKNP